MMIKRIAVVLTLATALGLGLQPETASAQSVKSRILRSLEVRQRDSGWEVKVLFSNPVHYLRHSPQRRGRVIQIQLSPIAVSRIDRASSFGREALRLPSGSPVPLRDVVYDGRVDDKPSLEVQFTRSVEFSVRQGKDFRSLVIEIAGTGEKTTRQQSKRARAHSYAVQLWAAPLSEPLPELSASKEFEGLRLYTSRFSKGGKAWRRLRAGFFRSESQALAAAGRLQRLFPEAWAVSVQRPEWIASSKHQIDVSVPEQARKREIAKQPVAPPRSAPTPPRAVEPVDLTKASRAELMEAGRRAMTAGELDRAVRIYTKVLSLEESESTPVAREFLGLARQRKGQLAHAKAEYQEYLERYPDGEGASRVRQRLDALLAARAEPGEKRSRPRGGFRDADAWGSAFVSYARSESITGPSGDTLLNSLGTLDLSLTGRVRSDRFDFRPQFAGREQLDFRDSPVGSDTEIITLLFDLTDRDLGLAGTFGRQSHSDGGILGRFDGLHLSYDVLDQWQLGAVVGFPVENARTDAVQFDKVFYGMSLDGIGLWDVLDVQVFGIGQTVDGITDRTAVGGELRYSDESRFLAAFVDYDVYFGSLNNASLVGTWSVTERTDLNLFFDYRNSPILTSENALQGQLSSSLGGLRSSFTKSEIKSLARDRTARSGTLTLGGSHRLNEWLEISGDATVTKTGSTPASGGVLAMPSTGYEFSYFLQFLGSDVLMKDDVGILGLRFFDGQSTDTYTLTLHGRYPLFAGLRANPRARFDFRDNHGLADVVVIRPSLRFDYSVWDLVFDAESGLEWTETIGESGAADDLGYTVNVGLRVDF